PALDAVVGSLVLARGRIVGQREHSRRVRAHPRKHRDPVERTDIELLDGWRTGDDERAGVGIAQRGRDR
ncbi:MAG: hypothetical protein IAG13_16955, partial [Deltaproteobacteria bacterium]|nr:hypothetical protein [Nannocystaceae bacterium]